MTSEGHRRLLLAVRDRGLTERTAAKLISVTHSAMHRYLREGRVPEGAILFRLARAFGIAPELFYVAAKEPAKRPRTKRAAASVA